MLLLCCDKCEGFGVTVKKQTKKSGTRKSKGLDPTAPRKHKSLTVHMNEYEYSRLVQGAKSAERGLLDFLRLALRKAIKAEIGD